MVEEKFRHDGGIAEFVEFLSHGEPVTDILRLQGTDTFTETVPLLDDKGHMTPQEVERELTVDVALRWDTAYDTELRSFVNVIATPKGGTHVSGFEAALTKTFNDAMRAAKVLKAADTDVIKDDVLEGLTAVVTVRLAEPQFEGQTKEILGTPAARSVVRKVVAAELKAFLTSTKRAEKAQAKLLMEKVAGASKTRLAARQHKENQRRKNALESSALPAKLFDCRSTDTERTELFIVEGDSAHGHREGGAEQRVPGAAADPRQDPQRPEGHRRRHAQERRVRLDHPGRRRRLGPDVRPRGGPLRPDHPDGRRRLRRRPHPLPARDPVLQVHARARRATAGSSRPCRRCTASSCPTPRRGWTSTSTRTPTTSCSASSPS